MSCSAVDGAGRHVGGVGAADEHEDPLDGPVARAPARPHRGELGAEERVRRAGEDARARRHERGVGRGTRAEVLVEHEVDRKGRSARSSMAIRTAPGTCRRTPANHSAPRP